MSRRITPFAIIALTLAISPAASAFEIKHSDAGQLVSWRRSAIAWTIDRSVRDVPGGEEAVASAIDAWTQRAGAPSIAIESTGAALSPGLDGKNVVFYAPHGYAPAGSALAVTVLSFDDVTGEVIDADIVINGKYRFAPIELDEAAGSSAKTPEHATYDIGRVLAHEMGHALGLSDEPALPNALMYPYVPRSRAFVSTPGKDDLLGLDALYGREASRAREASAADAASAKAEGCAVARMPSSSTSGSRSLFGGTLALVALAIGRRLIRRSAPQRTAQ